MVKRPPVEASMAGASPCGGVPAMDASFFFKNQSKFNRGEKTNIYGVVRETSI